MLILKWLVNSCIFWFFDLNLGWVIGIFRFFFLVILVLICIGLILGGMIGGGGGNVLVILFLFVDLSLVLLLVEEFMFWNINYKIKSLGFNIYK